MVFLTVVNFLHNKPSKFWRRRQILQLAAHLYGRKRNCFSIAIRNVKRSLMFGIKGRDQKKKDMRELWETRICAACEELDVDYTSFLESLAHCQIGLDRKSLADISVWEPRTFKAIAKIAATKAKEDGLDSVNRPGPDGVITRGML